MASADILRVWQEGLLIRMAVVVVESNGKRFEYIGNISVIDDLTSVGFAGKTWADLTNAQKKTALTTAVKAVRDDRLNAPVDVSGITGTITI